MNRSNTLLRLMTVGNKSLIGAPKNEENAIVIAGYASVPVRDSQGDLFTSMDFAKDQPFLRSQYRNLMYEHTPLQVGVIMDSYTTKAGDTHRTGIDGGGFYVVAMLRGDASYMDAVLPKVLNGEISAFSIGATRTDYGIQIHEISICHRGVNPHAKFVILHK